MSQHDLVVDNANGSTVRADINNALQALGSTSKGNAVPPTAYAGQHWLDDNTPSSTVWTESLYDGADSIELFKADVTNNRVVFASYQATDVASASTIDLDACTGDLVDVTGTTTVTAVTLAQGRQRTVRFTGALTLTHGASLVLPGAANITTAAGDFAVLRGYASSVVRCVSYSRASRRTTAADGTNALPAHTFESDPDTGMYLRSANTLGLSTGGTEAVVVTSGQDFVVNGSAASGRMQVNETGNRYAAFFTNSNAGSGGFVSYTSSGSYAGASVLALADRAANSAYSFLTAQSNYTAAADTEFNLRGDGTGLCDGSWTGGGADYAKYLEWADGNPDGEDRRGYSVVLDGERIRKATSSDAPASIIGVISGNPSIVDNAAALKWSGKYLRDEFGTRLTEEYQAWTWTEKQLVQPATRTGRTKTEAVYRDVEVCYPADAIPPGVKVPKDKQVQTLRRRVLNPAYDPAHAYTPREFRPEWSAVGLVGKVRVRKGQPVGDRWLKMREVSEAVEEWLVR